MSFHFSFVFLFLNIFTISFHFILVFSFHFLICTKIDDSIEFSFSYFFLVCFLRKSHENANSFSMQCNGFLFIFFVLVVKFKCADANKQTQHEKQTWSSWEFKFFYVCFSGSIFFFLSFFFTLVVCWYSRLMPNIICDSTFAFALRKRLNRWQIYIHTSSFLLLHQNTSQISSVTKRCWNDIFFPFLSLSSLSRSLTFAFCDNGSETTTTTTTRQKLNCLELIFSICDTFRALLQKFEVHKTVYKHMSYEYGLKIEFLCFFLPTNRSVSLL